MRSAVDSSPPGDLRRGSVPEGTSRRGKLLRIYRDPVMFD